MHICGMLDHKTRLSTFKKTDTISSIFSNNSMGLEINYKGESLWKTTNTQRPNNMLLNNHWGFPYDVELKNLPANAGDSGDTGSIPGSERSPGVGNGKLLQYFCLENSMDRENWWA